MEPGVVRGATHLASRQHYSLLSAIGPTTELSHANKLTHQFTRDHVQFPSTHDIYDAKRLSTKTCSPSPCICTHSNFLTSCTRKVRYCTHSHPTPVLDAEPLVKVTPAPPARHLHLTCRTSKDRRAWITRQDSGLTSPLEATLAEVIASALQTHPIVQHAASIAVLCASKTSHRHA